MSLRSELIHASLQASNNAARIDQAVNHLLHELHTLDGYPTTASGNANQGPRGQRCITVQLEDSAGDPLVDADGRPVTEPVPVTTVEDNAIKRQTLTDQLEDIAAHTHGITVMHNELARLITTALSTRIANDTIKRCDATGRDGWKTLRSEGGWADPTCTNYPDRGPLCIPCYHRERRWRISNGLPTREDSAA